LVHRRRTDVGGKEKELDQFREQRSDIELEHEKNVQRVERLHDQIRSLEDRKSSLAAERTRAVEELANNARERETKTVQLGEIDSEKDFVETEVGRVTAAVTDAAELRNAENRAIEQLRQQQFEMVGREARLKNEVSSRTEARGRIAGLIEKLEREEADATTEASGLEQQLTSARDEYAGQQTGFGQLKTSLA